MKTIAKNNFLPFSGSLNLHTGEIANDSRSWIRRLSEMIEVFDLNNQSQTNLELYDPEVYKVFEYDLPDERGHLIPVTTILYPGLVGDQFYMTKGHYHEEKGTAEVYLILSGEGVLLMQTEAGDCEEIYFQKGSLLYIPPYWAHRMVNVSINEPLSFYGVYPAHAGHDYASIVKDGFHKNVILDRNSKKNFKIVES
jgi:glucose-6-phosphate isomerase, archaeal